MKTTESTYDSLNCRFRVSKSETDIRLLHHVGHKIHVFTCIPYLTIMSCIFFVLLSKSLNAIKLKSRLTFLRLTCCNVSCLLSVPRHAHFDRGRHLQQTQTNSGAFVKVDKHVFVLQLGGITWAAAYTLLILHTIHPNCVKVIWGNHVTLHILIWPSSILQKETDLRALTMYDLRSLTP